MARRLATLLLACCVTLVGLTARPMAASCCIARQSAEHACCKAPQALRTATCCRGPQDVQHRTVNSQFQTPQFDLTAIGLVAPADLPTLTAHRVLAAPDLRGLAPPATLTAQHTSLLI